jgi:hypothetical protein
MTDICTCQGLTKEEIVITLSLVAPEPGGQVKCTLDGISCGDPLGCIAAQQAGERQGHDAE